MTSCTLCCEPLSARTQTLSCDHQFHPSCMIKWTDYIHRTDPQTTNLPCPNCRGPFQIAEPSSTLILRKIRYIQAGLILGATVFAGALGYGASTLSILGRVSSAFFKTLGISFQVVIPTTTSIAALIGSSFLLQEDTKCFLWIEKAITDAYNKKHGVDISSYEVKLQKWEKFRKSPEAQLIDTIWIFHELTITSLTIKINNLADCQCEEDRAYVQRIAEKLEQLDSYYFFHMDKVIASFTQKLRQESPDRLSRLYALGAHLLEPQDNEEEKTFLKKSLHEKILEDLKRETQDTPPNRARAVRMMAVSTLKYNIEKNRDFNNQALANSLTKIQEECKVTNSPLIQALSQSSQLRGFELQDLPLVDLLFKDKFIVKTYEAICEIKRDELQCVND